jgi:hypothetical protein
MTTSVDPTRLPLIRACAQAEKQGSSRKLIDGAIQAASESRPVQPQSLSQ